ncbi:MAG TPA: hypothetical protein VKK61_11610, partial [Tepidisphaeraceae bacterium]|nr:hypothetical protein [Tepidisphaeraceae bacterium]
WHGFEWCVVSDVNQMNSRGFSGVQWLPGDKTAIEMHLYAVILEAPLWFIISFLAIWPLIYIVQWCARRKSVQPGHCAQCGYDLRASKGRCPECGSTQSFSGDKYTA